LSLKKTRWRLDGIIVGVLSILNHLLNLTRTLRNHNETMRCQENTLDKAMYIDAGGAEHLHLRGLL